MGSFGPSRARRGSARRRRTASRRAAARGLPLLLGCNGDEQRLFLFAQRGLEEQAALRRLRAGLKRSALPAPPEAGALWAAYASQLGPLPPWQTLAAAETDLYYQLPLLRRGAAYARHGKGKGDCWLYRFDAPSPALKGQLGASHGLEVPYLFGTLEHPSVRRFAGTDSERWALADSFSASGLPSPLGKGPAGGPGAKPPRKAGSSP